MNKLLGAALVPMEACKSEKAQQHGSVVEESKCRTRIQTFHQLKTFGTP